jgi:hypothetical protein
MSCKLYYAKKDKNGFPIPGTMMGYDKDPCKDDLVLIESHDTMLGVDANGNTIEQCFHPEHLRYFVRLDCDGHILPNSLFSSLKHPGGSVAEFKKTFLVPAGAAV